MTDRTGTHAQATFEVEYALGAPTSVDQTPYEDKWPGISAVIRARDEEDVIELSVSSLLGIVDEIVVVDNGSRDGTVDRVAEVARLNDTATEVRLLSYDVPISRCGTDHAATDPEDPQSLVAFYNWTFSQARYRQSVKWDADMVATRFGRHLLSRLRLDTTEPVVISFERLPVYLRRRARITEALFDLEGRSREPFFHPSYPLSRYVKADLWERLEAPSNALVTAWIAALELKFIERDENHHWSSPDDMRRSPRKTRELEMFELLGKGCRDDAFMPVELTVESLQRGFDQAIVAEARAGPSTVG